MVVCIFEDRIIEVTKNSKEEEEGNKENMEGGIEANERLGQFGLQNMLS